MRLFISYSRDDKAWVYELWRALRDRAHHDAWIDQRIVPAQEWWDTILTNVEQSEAVIYVLTPKSVESIYCLAEVDYALALNKPVIPLMLKPCDCPAALRRIQYEVIEDHMGLGDVLFTVAQSLGEIRVNLLQGRYALPDSLPPRPDEPKPAARKPEQVSEVFMLAEEAASENNISLAEKLFQQVIDVDPQDYGLAAAERLGEIRYERGRNAEYLNVSQMAANPTHRKGALALWHVFVGKYGTEYDPNELASLLADRSDPVKPAPAVSAPSPPPQAKAPDGQAMVTADVASIRKPDQQPHKRHVKDLLPPPFEWIDIPAGKVTLEEGHGIFDVPAFMIAKFPVTNIQFQVFVDADDGYRDAHWWDYSPPAHKWRNENPQPRETGYPGNDLPRTNVRWYEAVAFCGWLSDRTGATITPPTEQQWQRAAQGGDGRKYPWGNQDPDTTLCNFAEHVGQPTPVTQYPAGASPYGVMDMSGNVWEWCLNEYDEPSNMDTASDARRVVRGGSWSSYQSGARAVYRYWDLPDVRNFSSLGFRVVCASPM